MTSAFDIPHPLRNARRGFTLLELLIVIAMIAVIMGAMTVSVGAARERARVQKAQAEVKSITQAVLGYESYAGDLSEHTMTDKDVDKTTIGFLLGEKEQSKEYRTTIPALLMASLTSGGKMLDPWGRAYRISIREKRTSIGDAVGTSAMKTSYVVPNFYRLAKEERE